MIKRKLLLFFLSLFLFEKGFAQLVNDGQIITINKGGLLSIHAHYKHYSGEIFNNGVVSSKNDWMNNDPQSSVFNITSSGLVNFSGNQQIIGGFKTIFSNLLIDGAGDKILETDIDVESTLTLERNQLRLESYNLTILNPETDAILRSSGFISTDKGGKLIRNTQLSAPYIFPLGTFENKLSGSDKPFYRPITIKPEDFSTNAFSVSLIPEDPDNNGFNRNIRKPEVENISDKYYYLLNREQGAANSEIKFFSNEIEDVYQNQLVFWGSFATWDLAQSTIGKDGIFTDGLDRYFSYKTTTNLQNIPFTFSNSSNPNFSANSITVFNAFSPDGDGKNDTWKIKNINLYPNNTLTILNRWGDEILKMKGYSNDKAWDGGTVSSGTYFYILDVVENGKTQVYKGFITLIKKD